MKSFSLTDITKIIGNNLANLRYNNQLIEAQRKIVNPTFLEILEELNKDDEVLAAQLMNWYMNKYGKDLDSKDLTKTILEQPKSKQIYGVDYNERCMPEPTYYGASCGDDDYYHNDRC